MDRTRCGLVHEIEFNIESGEAAVRSLRAEATHRLDSATSGDPDIIAACRALLELHRVEATVNRERCRLLALERRKA